MRQYLMDNEKHLESLINAVGKLAELCDDKMSTIIDSLTPVVFTEELATTLKEYILQPSRPESAEWAIESPGYYAWCDVGVEDEFLVLHLCDRDGNWDEDPLGEAATPENYRKLVNRLIDDAEGEWDDYYQSVAETGEDPYGHLMVKTTKKMRRKVEMCITPGMRFVYLKMRMNGQDRTILDPRELPDRLRGYLCLELHGCADWVFAAKEYLDENQTTRDERMNIVIHETAEWNEPLPADRVRTSLKKEARRILKARKKK